MEDLNFDVCCDVIDRVDAVDVVHKMMRPFILMKLLDIVDEKVNERKAANAPREAGRSDLTYVLKELTAKRPNAQQRNWKDTLAAGRQWKKWIKMGNGELGMIMVLAVSDIPVSWVEKKFTSYQLDCFSILLAQHKGLQDLFAELSPEVSKILATGKSGGGEHSLITY
jgi:hypothetical protein